VESRWFIRRRHRTTRKVSKTYRNPVALAQDWRKALDSGHYSSQADLARNKGISRARVTQILNLLRLSPAVIEFTLETGDPMGSRTITERRLRRLINLPASEQWKHVVAVLADH
jgi:hypothetical protein